MTTYSRPIRILHIFGCMDRGGAEMRTLDLFRRVQPDRFHFDFCSLSGRKGILDDEIMRLGGRVHCCKLWSLAFPFAFRRLLKAENYDVVHSHVHYFSGYILKLAHQCNVPCRIAHFRTTADGRQNSFCRRVQTILMKRWISRYATLILAVGEGAMREGWRRDWASDPRCVVIPNGLDTASFSVKSTSADVRVDLRIPAEAPLIIHVGNMVAAKNHKRLVAILSKVLASIPGVYALFVGKEDPIVKKMLLDCLESKGVHERVVFAGIRTDVPLLLKSSNLLLFPSVREGLPGAVLEACAAGTPTLASDIPGIQDIARVFPSVHTLSLTESDEAWQKQTQALLSNRLTTEMRESALIRFQRTVYDIECCLEAHMLAWEGFSAQQIKANQAGRLPEN